MTPEEQAKKFVNDCLTATPLNEDVSQIAFNPQELNLISNSVSRTGYKFIQFIKARESIRVLELTKYILNNKSSM